MRKADEMEKSAAEQAIEDYYREGDTARRLDGLPPLKRARGEQTGVAATAGGDR